MPVIGGGELLMGHHFLGVSAADRGSFDGCWVLGKFRPPPSEFLQVES